MFEKALLNKNVPSNFLKLSTFGAFLTSYSRGKLFHNFEATAIKDL